MKTTRNMTVKSISAINEKYAKSFKGASKGKKWTNSLDGVLDHVTKFWSHGYDSAFIELALTTTDKNGNCIDCKSMKTIRPIITAMINDFKGIDPRMTMIVTNTKGEQKVVPCIWGSKTLENHDVTPIIDAKGKETYPTIMTLNDKGESTPVKVDAQKRLTMTPDNIHLFVVQNMALLAGEIVPYTEDSFYADFDVDSKNMAVLKVAEMGEDSAPTTDDVPPTFTTDDVPPTFEVEETLESLLDKARKEGKKGARLSAITRKWNKEHKNVA